MPTPPPAMPPEEVRLTMSPASVGDIIQVTPRYLVEGQQTENVMYFRCVNASADFLADLLLVIAQCIITHLLPGLAADCQLESVRGQIVGPALGLEDEWIPAEGDIVVGGATGDAEPSFVAAVISLHTTRPGKSGRGRLFIAGIPEVGTIASLLKVEDVSYPALIAFVNCIVLAFPKHELGGSASFEWGVYSRKVGGVTKPPYPDAGFAPVTRAVVKRELGTMRSRKLGHGK